MEADGNNAEESEAGDLNAETDEDDLFAMGEVGRRIGIRNLSAADNDSTIQLSEKSDRTEESQ